MNFRAPREALLSALDAVAVVKTSKPAIPAFAGLKLTVSGKRLQIVAADGELTVAASVTLIDGVDGEVLVPAAMFSGVVSSLKGDDISAASAAGQLTLAVGAGRVSIKEMDVATYPKVSVPQGASMSIDAPPLLRGLAAVAIAAAEADRPQLNGVLVDPAGDGVCLVATDSYRIAVLELAGVGAVMGAGPVLLPLRLVKALGRALKHDRTIHVRTEANRVAFSGSNIVVIGRLLDSNFPAYANPLSLPAPNVLEIDTAALGDSLAVSRAVLDAGQATVVRLLLGADGLMLAASAGEAGSHVSTIIDTSRYSGSELNVDVDAAMLAEGLSALESEATTIRFSDDPTGPVTVSGGRYRYLLMPTEAE